MGSPKSIRLLLPFLDLHVTVLRRRPSALSHATSILAEVQGTTQRNSLLRTGFWVGLSNPKDLLFFGALIPQFILTNAPLLTQVITMTVIWCAVAFVLMAAYAAIGAIWIAAGTALAWTKRSHA